ncbi:hypothetical protein LMG18090_01243 [Ralstonia mannitolilytica]|uniref:hypothetical protein n=1 Tax=Ralstonia mannitolilytica TaxID=105219 RepID=UPI0028F66E06|nr:hypothetical protein [Ralstonia mannitolilytica]CAJ0780846.1 hypothetical protein LMG18090_01243 [Ralstonia mannitolilytica]
MTIKLFQSSQNGAPQLSGQPGTNTLIAVLNACLIDGFNLRTLTSITREGTVATATADAGHGLREYDIVLIAGANEAAYNGEKRIRNVTTNTFQFDVAGEPTTPATGTITAKIAPLGWESPFSGPAKAAYRSRDVSGNRLFLRIDETPLAGDANYGRGSRTALAQMWEALNDIDNGTGKAETWWRKAQNDNATARPWLLVGDTKRFWLAVNWSESYPNRYVPYFFGDFPSFKAGDAYGSLIAGYYDLAYNWHEPAYNEVTDNVYSVGSGVGNTGIWLARGYSQLGGRVNAQWVSAPAPGGSTGLGATAVPYPNPADNGIYVMPMMIQEQTGPSLRGRLPGLLCPLQMIPAPEPWRFPGFVIDGTQRELLVVGGSASSGNARLAFDLTGPWD